MIVDPEPNPTLPMYENAGACHVCGKVQGPRREVEHPERGIVLACGICAFVLAVPS